MNGVQALVKAKEFKELSKDCTDVTFIDGDTDFFEYVINLIEKTNLVIPVCNDKGVV